MCVVTSAFSLLYETVRQPRARNAIRSQVSPGCRYRPLRRTVDASNAARIASQSPAERRTRAAMNARRPSMGSDTPGQHSPHGSGPQPRAHPSARGENATCRWTGGVRWSKVGARSAPDPFQIQNGRAGLGERSREAGAPIVLDGHVAGALRLAAADVVPLDQVGA